MKSYRQGELVFIPVTELPSWAREQLAKGTSLGNCIREGEVSGHKHEINTGVLVEKEDDTLWQEGSVSNSVKLPQGEMFLTSDNKIEVRHPEHKTLELPKGDYVIRIQREYDEDKNRLIRD